MSRSVFLGLNAHWSLHLLRQGYADSLGRDLVVEFMKAHPSTGFYGQPDSPRHQKFDRALQLFFASLEPKNRGAISAREQLLALVDATIDIEEIFIHTLLATGADKVLYHGDDALTPDNLSLKKGELFSARNSRLPRMPSSTDADLR